MYQVWEILKDLDGHPEDREIKIKLKDGTILDIDGIQFGSIHIGGDDTIYLKEVDPLREKHEKRVEMFLEFCDQILDVCNKTYHKLKRVFDDDFDNCDILDIENEIAKSCDDWFRWLKLDIKYEPGCGSEDELYFKISVLKKWLAQEEIPKEVPVF